MLSPSNISFLGKGKDHIVFATALPGSIVSRNVIKVKQELCSGAESPKVKVSRRERSLYSKLNDRWFKFLRSLNFGLLFPALANETRVEPSKVDFQQLDALATSYDIQLSREFDVVVGPNLFFVQTPPASKSLFIEMKPKSLIKHRFSYKDVKMIRSISEVDESLKSAYNEMLKGLSFTGRAIYKGLTGLEADNYLLDSPSAFKKTLKTYEGTKYFEFKHASKHNGQIFSCRPKEAHDFWGMSHETFDFMLQKVLYHKYEFSGNKMTVLDVLRCFQNLFPTHVSALKEYQTQISKLDCSDEIIDATFSKMRELISSNIKWTKDLDDMDHSSKLLEAFLFMLAARTMSDCSLIFHLLQFDNSWDAFAFKVKSSNYIFKLICGRWIAFKCDLVDTELKRFTKMGFYLQKEEAFIESILSRDN